MEVMVGLMVEMEGEVPIPERLAQAPPEQVPTVLREETRVLAGSEMLLGNTHEVPPVAVPEMPPRTIPDVAGKVGVHFLTDRGRIQTSCSISMGRPLLVAWVLLLALCLH